MNLLDQVNLNNRSIEDSIARLAAMFHVDTSVLKATTTGIDIDKSVELTNVLENEKVTVTRGVWHLAGHVYPEHNHEDSVEYLICIAGKFVIQFKYGTRVLSQGDCMSIPREVKHTVIAMEDESEMIAICIPPEIAYRMLTPLRNRNERNY